VCFVPSAHVGGCNAWDLDNEPEEPLCRWPELRQQQDLCVAIGSHAVTHRGFSTLDAGAIEHEVRESKARLEDGLGRRVDALAYPYGDPGVAPDATADQLRAAG
jgi:peptidoglycan/xylan/chitin deacetylase (PgdA/CDA1 family)